MRVPTALAGVGGRARGVRPTAVRSIGVVGAGLLVTLMLGGCLPGVGEGWGESPADAEFVSQDGSLTVWEEGRRSGPVEIAGTDFTGEPVDVTAWRGDVVVLNTWYAACPPCRDEAPDLAAVATEYADRGVHVLGINSTDGVETALAFERTFAVPYPSLNDPRSAAIASLQGTVPVNAVPTTVVLDRAGGVAARVIGRVDPSTLRTLLDDLLDEAHDDRPDEAS